MAIESMKVQLDEVVERTVRFGDLQSELDQTMDDIEENQRNGGLSDDHPFVLRAPYHMFPKQRYTFQVDDLLSKRRADWYFYEFVWAKSSFSNYEEVTPEDGVIQVSPHSISGLAPSTPGYFYWKVKMQYKSTEGKVARDFDTYLEMVVKGEENMNNHQLHMEEGYHHGLGDSMNQHEKQDFLKYIIASLLLFALVFGIYFCITKLKHLTSPRQPVVREVEVADSI